MRWIKVIALLIESNVCAHNLHAIIKNKHGEGKRKERRGRDGQKGGREGKGKKINILSNAEDRDSRTQIHIIHTIQSSVAVGSH